MTVDEANVLRTILMKRVVPRDAEEGVALAQLGQKLFEFVVQHQPAPVPAPAPPVADASGK
jgi:hypothetical protein